MLNHHQQAAIHATEQSCQVLAGPGSGKTYVLTHHLQFLVKEQSIPSSSILVVTFSKAAALEMKHRYRTLIDEEGLQNAMDITFGTFHSIFYHILNESTNTPFILLPAKERLKLFTHLLAKYYEMEDVFERPDPVQLNDAVSYFKTTGKYMDFINDYDIFSKVYAEYQDYLSSHHAIDFEDMIFRCISLFETHPSILLKWQNRFRHILIDEFQDIDPHQYHLIRLLVGTTGSLFAVGDDDQSIYSFRGADPSFMKKMLEDFSPCKQYVLAINYRSSEAVTKAAMRLIKENTNRFPKEMKSMSHHANTPVSFETFESTEAEDARILSLISKMTFKEKSQTAIIYRTNAQAAHIRSLLSMQNSKPSKLNFLYQQAIPVITSYYQAAKSLRDHKYILRKDYLYIANLPERYLTREAALLEEKITLSNLLSYYQGNPHMRSILVPFFYDCEKLFQFPPYLSFKYLMKTIGLETALYHSCKVEERASLQKALQRISVLSRTCDTLTDFLTKLSTFSFEEPMQREGATCPVQRKDATCPIQREEPTCPVHVLTMHASKGLEYKTVILPDLNEGVIPIRRAVNDGTIEEERRLLYVAMTRAKESLYMFTVIGTKDNPRTISRFLDTFRHEVSTVIVPKI